MHTEIQETFVTARQAAFELGSTIRNIENWAADGNIKQNEDGKYGLISIYKYQLDRARLDLARAQLRVEKKDEKLNLHTEELIVKANDAKLRKSIAEADKEEAIARLKKLEADQLEGVVVDKQSALNAWNKAIGKVKAKFISLPSKLALELSGISNPEIVAIRLRNTVDEALRELGEGIEIDEN